MECTLNESILPPVALPKETDKQRRRRANIEIQSVWDINANAWRSFKWDSIIEVSKSENGS